MSDQAYFGRSKCDVPYLMVDVAMQKMKADNPDIDFILVPGDLVGHAISVDLDDKLTPLQVWARYQ